MSKHSGYTLLEMICLLVCIGVFLAITSATWVYYSANFKTHAAAYQMKNAIVYARQQAIRRGHSVMFCGSGDHLHCDGHWSLGQLIKLTTSPQITLRRLTAFRNGEKITLTSNFGRNNALTFLSSGLTDGQQGHFTLCNTRQKRYASHCLWVTFGLSGQVAVKEDY